MDMWGRPRPIVGEARAVEFCRFPFIHFSPFPSPLHSTQRRRSSSGATCSFLVAFLSPACLPAPPQTQPTGPAGSGASGSPPQVSHSSSPILAYPLSRFAAWGNQFGGCSDLEPNGSADFCRPGSILLALGWAGIYSVKSSRCRQVCGGCRCNTSQRCRHFHTRLVDDVGKFLIHGRCKTL